MTDLVLLYDKKRCKALKRSQLFNFLPFIEKVYLAGSLALGNVHENSDFDVIIVAKPGRLYTARFFCLLLFNIFDWRRTLKNPRDGFCFNHFNTGEVKPAGFLGLIGNYEKKLHQNLIPVLLSRRKSNIPRSRYIRLFERVENLLEKILKKWQIKKIEKFLKKFPPGPNSRIIYNDERVELCFFLKNLAN